MRKMYLADVFDGLFGDDREVYKEELLRRGFSEEEVLKAEQSWDSFRSKSVGTRESGTTNA